MNDKSRALFLSAFLPACGAALILLLAALLKWIYPSSRDPLFYKMVGGVEALLAGVLVTYSRSWRVWTILALMASLWMGMSLYTTLFGIPCACLGEAATLPRGMSLVINGAMLLTARWVLHRQPAHSVRLKQLLWFCVLFLMIGFSFSTVYFNYKN